MQCNLPKALEPPNGKPLTSKDFRKGRDQFFVAYFSMFDSAAWIALADRGLT